MIFTQPSLCAENNEEIAPTVPMPSSGGKAQEGENPKDAKNSTAVKTSTEESKPADSATSLGNEIVCAVKVRVFDLQPYLNQSSA